MTNTLKYLGIILILSTFGFIISEYFFNYSFSQITNESVKIFSSGLSGQFYSHILFALSIGITPLLYFFIKKITKIDLINKGLISYGIIIGCGILFWQYRIFQLKHRFQTISEFYKGNEIQTELRFDSLRLDSLNFENYLFVGFLAGTILSTILFKSLKKTVTE